MTDQSRTPLELVTAELARQATELWFTPEHDLEHERGHLEKAARTYLMPPQDRRLDSAAVPVDWPFEGGSWHPLPEDRESELVKGAAMAIAAIARNRLEEANALEAARLQEAEDALAAAALASQTVSAGSSAEMHLEASAGAPANQGL